MSARCLKLQNLVAKHIDKDGCIALKTMHGKHLFDFKRNIVEIKLNDKKSKKGKVQNKCSLVTVLFLF